MKDHIIYKTRTNKDNLVEVEYWTDARWWSEDSCDVLNMTESNAKSVLENLQDEVEDAWDAHCDNHIGHNEGCYMCIDKQEKMEHTKGRWSMFIKRVDWLEGYKGGKQDMVRVL